MPPGPRPRCATAPGRHACRPRCSAWRCPWLRWRSTCTRACPRALAELAMASAATHEGSGNQVETAVARLTERLRANPDDLEG